MTLPIDRTAKAAIDTNLVNGVLSDGPKLKASDDVVYNTIDELYNFTTGLISAGTLSKLGVINVMDYNASGLATTFTGGIAAGTKVLTLTTTPDFVAGQGINLQGALEASSLQVTGAATVSSNVTVTLNGVAFLVAVVNGDTAIQVATKIRAATYTGWTAGGTAGTDTVTFTSTTSGVKTDSAYSAGTTGATGTMTTTTQGTADQISTVSSVSGLVVNIADNATRTITAGMIKHSDTAAIQAAMNAVAAIYGGDTSSTSGYIGWYESELIFPAGTYLCGTVTCPTHIKMRAIGAAVIQSESGAHDLPVGNFINNTVVNIYVERLTFLYFNTVFTLPTGNSDFSFMTFDRCKFAYCNVGIDTVSFALSRSTSFKMTRCNVSYGVPTICKVYTDKSFFEGNWFSHSADSIFMYLDSFATFKDNVWVPTTQGVHKAYISFTSSDETRSLDFKGERFGSENGSCPIVVVNNVNTNNANNAYRMQGVSFDDCVMASNSNYDPSGLGVIRACVVLSPTVSTLQSINYLSFKNCDFLPDLSGGVVQTYNVTDITALVDSDFTIDFDYASAVSASKGVNIPASTSLAQYVKTPILHRKTSLISKGSGKLKIVATATAGLWKGSFKIDRTYPTSYHTPLTFLVTTVGQGDSSYPSTAYAYQSVYILTISSQNGATTYSKISWTKLHGTVGGASAGANADIPANGVFWGTADTGSVNQDVTVSGTNNIFDVTITFGTRVGIGNVYVQPLYDFSLLT